VNVKLPDLGTAVVRASTLLRSGVAANAHAGDGHAAETWPRPGTVIELTGDFAAAATSTAVGAVADAQRTGGITAWVQARDGALFPPDVAASGVDLEALAVVHLPPVASTGSAAGARSSDHGVPAAAELLLRSGAFDLIVLDLRPAPPKRGAWLGRLQALARQHHTRVLLLTDASTPLTFATGLAQRLAPHRRRDGDRFVVEPVLQRDKLHTGELPPVRSHGGPAGL
jgi:hypothetical protein